MPRANRHFLPGHVWHITINTVVGSDRSKRSTAALRSSSSNKELRSIKFSRDWRLLLTWLFEAKRFGLYVLIT